MRTQNNPENVKQRAAEEEASIDKDETKARFQLTMNTVACDVAIFTRVGNVYRALMVNSVDP